MDLKTIERNNKAATKKAARFRKKATLETRRVQNDEFHQYRNEYPYYGLVEVNLDGCKPFVMYSNNDDLVVQTYFWYGANSYERKSVAEWVVRAKQCDTILDVGAFTGLFAMAAHFAHPGAKVHAFEATRKVYGRFIANLQANRIQHSIVANNLAISNREDCVTFFQYRAEHVLGTGASFIDKGIEVFNQDETVKTQALDVYAEEKSIRPGLLKIDVEGAELLALEGMVGILDQDQPQIIVEVSPKTIKPVIELLSRFDYQFYGIDEATMELHPTDGADVRSFCNILAEVN